MTATDVSGAAPTTEENTAPAGQSAEAQEPARAAAAVGEGQSSQVVSFCLGDEEYGVDIMTVQEIILFGCITQVPEVPDHVLGVINLRGNVIPILNLRRRFGMPDQPAEDATRIVVMNLNGRTVGVVVDGVNEVLRLSEDEVSPTPQSLSGAGKDYVTGLARRGERLLILLDMARLLGSGELGEVSHSGKNGDS
ncbi:MAG: chemotaxis protein CheW [Planctomycetota bacterium]